MYLRACAIEKHADGTDGARNRHAHNHHAIFANAIELCKIGIISDSDHELAPAGKAQERPEHDENDNCRENRWNIPSAHSDATNERDRPKHCRKDCCRPSAKNQLQKIGRKLGHNEREDEDKHW